MLRGDSRVRVIVIVRVWFAIGSRTVCDYFSVPFFWQQQQEDEEMLVPHADLVVEGPQPMEGDYATGFMRRCMDYLVSIYGFFICGINKTGWSINGVRMSQLFWASARRLILCKLN